jgi:hypothetical protein
MNATIQLVFTIAGALLVLVSLYGAISRNRKLFISGYCFYSILPVIGESMAYNTDKVAVHLLVVFMFLIQFVLEIPDNTMYGRDNLAATSLATKMGFAILVINIGAAIYVFGLNSGVPVQFGYYHVAFVAIMLYVMARRFTSPTVSWAK